MTESVVPQILCGNPSCGKIGKFPSCGKCRIRYYCSVSCQSADWPNHKKLCTDEYPEVKELWKQFVKTLDDLGSGGNFILSYIVYMNMKNNVQYKDWIYVLNFKAEKYKKFIKLCQSVPRNNDDIFAYIKMANTMINKRVPINDYKESYMPAYTQMSNFEDELVVQLKINLIEDGEIVGGSCCSINVSSFMIQTIQLTLNTLRNDNKTS